MHTAKANRLVISPAPAYAETGHARRRPPLPLDPPGYRYGLMGDRRDRREGREGRIIQPQSQYLL